jgi:predicted nucleic acid-binding protein
MNIVLVDTSAWIDFFKGLESASVLLDLIDANRICINDLILAELLPSINHRKENNLKDLLNTITKIDLKINWHNIIGMQTLNLENGINNAGIADLIIVQNAIDNNIALFTVDKHFSLMSNLHGLRLFNSK